MVYDIQGNSLQSVYAMGGGLLSQCYDVDGNPLMGDTPDPPTPSEYNTFSVLGNSYSALQGYVTPSTNAVWYPASGNDVDTPEEMWWYQFGKGLGVDVDVINAYSGSRVANDSSWAEGVENCYIGRATNIGEPDIILLMGGTNDVWNAIPQGDYVYSNWSESDLATFRGALAYLLNYLLTTYNAKVVFLCNTINNALSPDQEHYPFCYEYYVSAHTICDHYSVDVIDFNVDVYGNHPTAYGMRQINHLLMRYFEVTPNIVDTLSLNTTFPITATWNPQDNGFTLSKALKKETLYKVEATITNYSADSAYIQIQTNGSPTAQLCNFSKYAGQTGIVSVIVWASGYADGVSSISISCNKGTESSNQTAVISNIVIYEVEYNS